MLKVKKLAKNLIFILFWTYCISQIYFINIDNYLIHNLGLKQWILNCKLLFLLIVLCIFWLILGTKRFIFNFLHFVLYIPIIIFWVLPKLFFWILPTSLAKSKKWILMYSYINFWINHLIEMKQNILKIALLVLSIAIIINTNSKVALIISITVLAIIYILNLANLFKSSFTPLSIFRINIDKLKMKENERVNILESIYNTDFNKSEEADEEKSEKDRTTKLETFLLFHILFNFISNKLKNFLNKQTYMLYFMFKIIYSFIFCWFLLSLINYSIYLIGSNSFIHTDNPNFFDFIFYSFHSIFFSSIKELYPQNILSKVVNIAGALTGVSITTIIVTAYFTVKSAKYNENIANLISITEKHLFQIEEFLKHKLKLTVIDVMSELESKNSQLIILINKLKKVE